jgi:hypothetical protein
MNTSTLAAAPDLGPFAILLVGLGTIMIALHFGILLLAAQRTSLTPGARLIAPLMTVILLALWFGWANRWALDRAAAPPSASAWPLAAVPVLLAMIVPIAVGVLALRMSRSLRLINSATPPEWLIAVQTYRMAGIIFIWPFLTNGTLPAGFALPAGIGDFLTGIAAPFVALAVAQGRPGARRRAMMWNWFGILDLIVAPTAAVLTQANIASIYPLALVPLFLGPPIGILTHICSLRSLSASSAPAEARLDPAKAGLATT